MLSVFSDAELEQLRQQTPLSFLGEPKDVAALAVYLASDSARYMTGQIIGINGGFVIV